MKFQSTLPARGATNVQPLLLGDKTISIHAPRTGSDFARYKMYCMLPAISIHAPRTGSDDPICQRVSGW